jgi:HAMP domain-containing protein
MNFASLFSAFPLGFSAPLVLSALVLLPVLWLVLRVTPPQPQRIDFPPLKIFADLAARQQTPARTPWWLLLLRMLAAAAVILAMAGPIWNPVREATSTQGPLLLLVDNGFPAARDWNQRLTLAESRIVAAGREGRVIAIAGLADAPAAVATQDAGAAIERLRALLLQPHAPDRVTHLPQIDAFLKATPGADIVWISDGVRTMDAAAFVARLKDVPAPARLTIHSEPSAALAFAGQQNTAAALSARIVRANASGAVDGTVRALDARGLLLGEAPFAFAASDRETTARITLPIEVRNAIARLDITGEHSAGAVLLLDDRAKRRRVGIVSGTTSDTAQPLLSPTYYVSRALGPFAEVREPRGGSTDPVGELLAQNLTVLVLADIGALDSDTAARIRRFVERGGVLLRFAGPRLASTSDDLTPVRLRRGGRSLGGALSWDAPRSLAPFPRESPLFGLQVKEDVKVTRQILAEPEADLAAKTWAALEDGTPVMTGDRRGDGMIVMVHVTADTTWSNLPLSGLFVDMLRRVVQLAGSAQGQGSVGEDGAGDGRADLLPARRVLDGYGVARDPAATTQGVPRSWEARATLQHPPGFYGAAEGGLAINALTADDQLAPLDFSGLNASILPIDKPVARDLRPLALVAGLLLLIIDTLATLWLGGRLRRIRPIRAAPAAMLLAALVLIPATGDPALAQSSPTPFAAPVPDTRPPITRDQVAAGTTTRMAYVVTGDRAVDDVSKAGLTGLTYALGARTALEAGDPVGVDPVRDELAFYPVLYWPIVAGRTLPAPETLRRIETYMKGGGLVIFDTRDALVARPGGGATPEALHLRRMLQTLDIPELEPVPRDHVLTKTFYLLEDFPGRYATGQTWTEVLPPVAEDGRRPARAGDSVSPIIITSNDLAAGWAVGKRGEPLLPISGSDPRQREMSLRAGVNIVMYALTGNYKADQVHVPALLERLGQ